MEAVAVATAALTWYWMERSWDGGEFCDAAATAVANAVGVVRIDYSDTELINRPGRSVGRSCRS